MAMNGNGMASEIVAAINTLSSAEKGNTTKVWEKVAGAIIQHLITNMEIKGVQCQYNIGTLIAGANPVTSTGSPTVTQNNDGTGRVL